MLDKYFDRITCVCLPQRQKLWTSLESQINSLGGTLSKFMIGTDYVDIEAPSNWTGRNSQSYNYMMCFFEIIAKAKKDKIKNILYMEDDVCILPIFKFFLPIIMDNSPKNWHMIYFGPGHHEYDFNTGEAWRSEKYNLVSPYMYVSTLHLGMQMVAINEKMYDYLLDLKNKEWLHENPYIDITIAHQFHRGNSIAGKLPCYGAFPYLVCETSGMSYNERNEVKRPEYELWKDILNV